MQTASITQLPMHDGESLFRFRRAGKLSKFMECKRRFSEMWLEGIVLHRILEFFSISMATAQTWKRRLKLPMRKRGYACRKVQKEFMIEQLKRDLRYRS